VVDRVLNKIKENFINLFVYNSKTTRLDKSIANEGDLFSKKSKTLADNFIENILEYISVGDIIENPGGGTSTIMSISKNKICYKRGNSNIYI
jgi:hypothetical protein